MAIAKQPPSLRAFDEWQSVKEVYPLFDSGQGFSDLAEGPTYWFEAGTTGLGLSIKMNSHLKCSCSHRSRNSCVIVCQKKGIPFLGTLSGFNSQSADTWPNRAFEFIGRLRPTRPSIGVLGSGSGFPQRRDRTRQEHHEDQAGQECQPKVVYAGQLSL